MNTFEKVLLPLESNYNLNEKLLLIARVVFGLLFMRHGIEKWVDFNMMADRFPNPLGLGSEATLIIIIIIEVFCSAALIVGFLSRLALLPMIFDMFIVITVVFAKASFAMKEIPLLYFIIFLLLLFTGPDKYASDSLIGRSINRRMSKVAE